MTIGNHSEEDSFHFLSAEDQTLSEDEKNKQTLSSKKNLSLLNELGDHHIAEAWWTKKGQFDEVSDSQQKIDKWLQQTAKEMLTQAENAHDTSLHTLKNLLTEKQPSSLYSYFQDLLKHGQPHHFKVSDLKLFLSQAVAGAITCEMSLTDYLKTLEGLKNGSLFLKDLPQAIRSDKLLVHTPCEADCTQLFFATKKLKDNPTFILEAIKKNPHAFSYASKKVKNNLQVVVEVVKREGEMLAFASKRLRDDQTVVTEAMRSTPLSLRYAGKTIKDNTAIVYQAILSHPHLLQWASHRLQNEPMLVSRAVVLDGMVLQFASKTLKNNPSLAMSAFQSNLAAIPFVGKRALSHPNVLSALGILTG